ncbi:hypothetical protein [Azoarcus sp. KH32C]|uniref:hypothetical protein n=1 Tax=Azoarcus sp. KH32C TaxID=748247 RepID=UPI0002386DC5|nr:hypothetical protein [Azoarcus sp. KH32C]BAL24953.1 hypothetical protein AZKH_2647 [Azoarcus sp. KH32C]
MHCTIHCLVSGENELTPLMERISEAGIADEDVYVVWRNSLGIRHDPAFAGNPPTPWDTLGQFFVPAALWWGLASGAWCIPAAEVPSKGHKPARMTVVGGQGYVPQNETGPD